MGPEDPELISSHRHAKTSDLLDEKTSRKDLLPLKILKKEPQQDEWQESDVMLSRPPPPGRQPTNRKKTNIQNIQITHTTRRQENTSN